MAQHGENNPADGIILYSFRRCPYAMRARLAVHAAGLKPEHREILLRDKAPEFLAASPKGTVPVLVTSSETLEESLDIMFWALSKNDPEGLLERCDDEVIAENDGPFKEALDRYKYPNRYDTDPIAWRERGGEFLSKLDRRLEGRPNLHGDEPGLTDLAVYPFVRQYANTDRAWFDGKDWSNLQNWLARHLDSARFAAIMVKYPKWQLGDPVTLFGNPPLATGEKSHQG